MPALRLPSRVALRSGALLLLGLLVAAALSGCGGESSDSAAGAAPSDSGSSSKTLRIVTVNWIEGRALSYVQAHLLSDSLGVPVDVNEVNGGGIAFASVASGNADFFNEAWLPTTHREPWERHKGKLQALGYTYRGTSVGLAVPAYVPVDSVPDLRTYRDALGGTIHGIESGAAINQQTRGTLERYGLDDGFSVTAASGPATWAALERAIDDREPIVTVAWKPHWKWEAHDLKYVDGARTGHNVDIWGRSEDIFAVVDTAFLDTFPKRAACFLQAVETNDRQIGSLMAAFRDAGDRRDAAVARQWVRAHPADVQAWLDATRTCAASDEPVTPLPDSIALASTRRPTQ
jgi:glycine betaine/proline transport system substrate-binding protein